MTRLNKRLEYALILLGHLVKEPGIFSASDAEARFGLSFDVASKVLQTLAQAGHLRSVKGAHGGYVLASDPSTLTLLDLHRTLLGPVQVASCLEDGGHCDLSPRCTIVAPVAALNRRVESLFQGLTLGDLFATPNTASLPDMTATTVQPRSSLETAPF